MTDDNRENTELDAWFDAARQQAPAPPEALMRRVLADADAVQAATARARPGLVTRARASLARGLATLGGTPAMAGLATAAVVGMWLGAWPPAALESLGPQLFDGTAAPGATYTVDLMPGAEFTAPDGGGEDVNDV
ncbi:hypothetical protein [Sediminimonas sp.]|uniref:hypothetical protein n=1 Tax=Sediminimonas sp. TaxID=2823379 RepID=UPI0025F1994F|nr:hypothetical protein [Sediminimonas sp.]